MLKRARKFAEHRVGLLSLTKQSPNVSADEVRAARAYIADYWQHLKRTNLHDKGSLIGLPNPYVVSSASAHDEFAFEELYYWDSYFTIQGFLHDPKYQSLVVGVLENLIALFKRFHAIPNGSRTYYSSRSQPPLLTSFIFDVYDAYQLDETWLKPMIETAQVEYETVWLGTQKPNVRLVYQGLSRYFDLNYLHDLAEAESGWDYTPRFRNRALDYLPVDLNALLYKYETDFARAARIFGHETEAQKWDAAALRRKQTMNALMWSSVKGLFYDFNFKKEKRGSTQSLATYFPLWAGMVDAAQAKALVKNLRRFLQKGGLATTDSLPLALRRPGAKPMQWAYPNGWAPLHFITVMGLKGYGFDAEARRIALMWLKTNLLWFERHGEFLEKYNVVDPSRPPVAGVYPSQKGFGWTNAVFERFCQEFIDQQT